ncbi:hypothetical protein IIA79_04905 [bacterium]|nr:hypothetical protein [bacterium]
MHRAFTFTSLALLVFLLAACPREYPPGENPAEFANATHPWELPGWKPPPGLKPAATQRAKSGDVKLPKLRGPALPADDTLDPALLPGRWLLVCSVREEKMELMAVGEMDLVELRRDGTVAYNFITGGEGDVKEGTWGKLEPGVVGLAIGNTEMLELYGQIFGEDFLYLWNYDFQVGHWFVRLPVEATERIEANSFRTSWGELKFKDVVQQSYSGTLSAESEISVGGFYESGVLSMRWEDERSNRAGFAAFRVGAGWNELQGTWWIDDYEAAPFGGSLDGENI